VQRSVDREGRLMVRRLGMPRPRLGDVYHTMLSMRWIWLCLLVGGMYVLVNVVFAALYMVQPGSIENARPDSFLDHFYFSVQTMATIGYGKMTPGTDLANILVAIEALLGMLGIAMATGLIFAKFARTRPRVLFSEALVVTTMDGKPTLMFRLANERSTQIVEAQLTVTVLRDEPTKEGEFMRRMVEIPLVRSRSAMFALSWSAIHPIDEKSPFFGATPESLAAVNLELIVSMLGMEEVTGQTVHARHAYHWSDIRWGHRFVDIFTVGADGGRTMDLGKFHEIVVTPGAGSGPG
jgi:inward rectifier potassium channel